MRTCISYPTGSQKNFICKEFIINEARNVEGYYQLPLSRNSGGHSKRVIAVMQPGFFGAGH